MTGITFDRHEIDARHGRYVARVAGREGEAEIRFTHRGPGVISADHTEAPESLRGTGAAAALVGHMIDDARKTGLRIRPDCPYVLKLYARHPEWQDVMTLPPG